MGAPQALPARTRDPLARRRVRSAPAGAAGALPTVLQPGTPGPRGLPRKMKLALLLPWACCCLCGSALATGFLYPFPAAALRPFGSRIRAEAAQTCGRGARMGATVAGWGPVPASSPAHVAPPRSPARPLCVGEQVPAMPRPCIRAPHSHAGRQRHRRGDSVRPLGLGPWSSLGCGSPAGGTRTRLGSQESAAGWERELGSRARGAGTPPRPPPPPAGGALATPGRFGQRLLNP